jgi:Na+/H+ antiporter NhaD/arsenite permease-like protein
MPAAVPPPGVDKPAVLVIFALTYLGLAVGRIPGLKVDRTGIAVLGAIAILIFSGLHTADVVEFVNWPTLLLLFSFFVISAQLRLSGFFDLVANGVARRLANPTAFLVLLMLATAGLSAFLNHDIVCFVFAPIVAAAVLRQRLDPVPFLIALAIASNIGAAATLVGNPQGMMIEQIGNLAFGSYVAWCFVPTLFGLACACAIIWLMSRGSRGGAVELPAAQPAAQYPFNLAHTIKGLVILMVVIGLFFTGLPKEVVALTAAAIHLASPRFRSYDLLQLVDWQILVLFMGLFVVTGAFQATGCGEQAVAWLSRGGLNLDSPRILALATAALSNLINNSAAVMLLIKVANVSSPPAAYVLSLANSIGGSLVVVGSVANIIVVQQARELGIDISFRAFARIGIPVTIAAMAGLLGWITLVG